MVLFFYIGYDRCRADESPRSLFASNVDEQVVLLGNNTEHGLSSVRDESAQLVME